MRSLKNFLFQEIRLPGNHRLLMASAVLAAIALALVLAASPLRAQEVTGAINGTVTDPSGAPMVGATVTATDVARGTTYPAKTNSDGAYYLTQLPIGRYTVKVESTGFQTAVKPAFDLVL